MKNFLRHRVFLTLAFCLATFALSSTAHAESLSISTTLIRGSNEGGGTDASLKQYESKLKHHFPYDTFKSVGSSSTSLEVPGSGSLKISGNSVTFNATPDGSGRYRISARWTKDGKTLQNTTVVTSKNSPTVLASSSRGDSTLILLFVPR